MFILIELGVEYGNCSDGDVRLMDGSNLLDGRLEICINDAWGTICRSLFGQNEAEVVCAHLGATGKAYVCAIKIYNYCKRYFNHLV